MPRSSDLPKEPRSRLVLTVVAMALVVALVPAGVRAAGDLVSLVDGDGNSKAQVDGGKLRVGDGNGPLTVNGKVVVAPKPGKALPVRAVGVRVQDSKD